MSRGETTRSTDTCTLFMAPSTIPNAGIGVFTAVDVKEGENVGYPDLAIPVTDVDWHNGGDRQVSSGDLYENDDKRDILRASHYLLISCFRKVTIIGCGRM